MITENLGQDLNFNHTLSFLYSEYTIAIPTANSYEVKSEIALAEKWVYEKCVIIRFGLGALRAPFQITHFFSVTLGITILSFNLLIVLLSFF